MYLILWARKIDNYWKRLCWVCTWRFFGSRQNGGEGVQRAKEEERRKQSKNKAPPARAKSDWEWVREIVSRSRAAELQRAHTQHSTIRRRRREENGGKERARWQRLEQVGLRENRRLLLGSQFPLESVWSASLLLASTSLVPFGYISFGRTAGHAQTLGRPPLSGELILYISFCFSCSSLSFVGLSLRTTQITHQPNSYTR